MTNLDLGDHREYCVKAEWGARPQTPDDIAARFVRQVDALAKIDPLLSSWECFVPSPSSPHPPIDLPEMRNFETVRDRFVEDVIANIEKSDDGEPIPMYGYRLIIGTRAEPRSESYTLVVNAGIYHVSPHAKNKVSLQTRGGGFPYPSTINYQIFKSALLSFVDTWDPEYGRAYPTAIFALCKDRYSPFHEAWIHYLSPPLARQIMPPDTAIVEHLPNGGLLMSATTETFRVDNPAHLAAARDIEAAMAPLNKPPG